MIDPNEFNAPLGPGDYCETCGYSYDEIDGSFEDGEVYLAVRYGCYGGESYQGSPAEVAVEFAREWDRSARETFDNPDAFSDALDWVRGLA